MTYRIMVPDDYDGLYSLWLSCVGMGLNNLDDSREGIEKFLLRNPDTCFVAEEAGRIVGCILVGNDGRRAYIHHTAVAPDCRHQGIASHLVETAIDALRRIGIHKVTLVAFNRNREGNAFWERMGFALREDLSYRDRQLSEMERIDT